MVTQLFKKIGNEMHIRILEVSSRLARVDLYYPALKNEHLLYKGQALLWYLWCTSWMDNQIGLDMDAVLYLCYVYYRRLTHKYISNLYWKYISVLSHALKFSFVTRVFFAYPLVDCVRVVFDFVLMI